jgi:CSLREA domain-containing protein
MYPRTRIRTDPSIANLLVILAVIGAWPLAVGFTLPPPLAPAALTPPIHVTTTGDVLADDGLCSLREAVIAANTNTASGASQGECRAGSDSQTDLIILAEGGTYSLTLDSSLEEDGALDGDLDIWDNPAAADLIIEVEAGGVAIISQDAALDDRVLHILGATVEIEGLAITGGFHQNEGGGVALHGGALTAVRSHVTGNTTPGGGGGISNDGTLVLEHSTVSANASDTGGGVLNGGVFEVVDSLITGNSALAGGGGVWNSGVMQVVHSRINGNLASGGGGIFNDGGEATIKKGSQVDGNTASNIGGGVVNTENNSTLTVTGSSLSGNIAVGASGMESCGGLENQAGATALLVRTTISGNQASWNGAGLCNGGSLTVENSRILDNSGTGDGGGVHNGGNLDMYASRVVRNHAGWGGGFINNGVLNLYRTRVTGNTASEMGGGIANWPGASLTLAGSLVSRNSAPAAGGLHNQAGGVAVVTDSAITHNSVNSLGGGILNEGELALEATRLVANVAGGAGGGVFNWGALTITGSALLDNTSFSDGDALFNDVDVVNATSLSRSCIAGNGDTAVFNNQPASQNAVGNWWGDASGPSGAGPGSGDSVSAGVDFTGWLASPPATCASK